VKLALELFSRAQGATLPDSIWEMLGYDTDLLNSDKFAALTPKANMAGYQDLLLTIWMPNLSSIKEGFGLAGCPCREQYP